jgi:small subunit ribosomal protein S4
MQIKSKYKIARRLGAPIYEKTQTAKFALRKERKQKAQSRKPRQKTEYGLQMLEKQKARFTYGVNERQFSNYVKKAMDKKGNAKDVLLELLESRLDNVVYRLGLAKTRLAARQMVSHGHITVEGKKVSIPSYAVSVGEKISIREGSKAKTLFADFEERFKTITIPAWLKFNLEKREATVDGIPRVNPTELMFNIGSVLEFYTR